MVLVQKQTHRSMERDIESRNKPTHMFNSSITNYSRIYSGEKIIYALSGAGKIGQHVKE